MEQRSSLSSSSSSSSQSSARPRMLHLLHVPSSLYHLRPEDDDEDDVDDLSRGGRTQARGDHFRSKSKGVTKTKSKKKVLGSPKDSSRDFKDNSESGDMRRCDSNTSLHSLSTVATAEESLGEYSFLEGLSGRKTKRKSALKKSPSSPSTVTPMACRTLMGVHFGGVTVHYHSVHGTTSAAGFVSETLSPLDGNTTALSSSLFYYWTMGGWIYTCDFPSVETFEQQHPRGRSRNRAPQQRLPRQEQQKHSSKQQSQPRRSLSASSSSRKKSSSLSCSTRKRFSLV